MAGQPKPTYSVALRELAEFVLRRGDLGTSGEFAGSDRALAGVRGHQRIQRSRTGDYRKEVPVIRAVDGEEFVLRVQGRIDGVLVREGGVTLEEIKTVRGGSDRTADPVHWAQLRLYGSLYADEQALESLDLQLVYLDLDTSEVTEFREHATRSELADLFSRAVGVYLEWVADRHRWCRLRDASIGAVGFPFPRYRPGQREIAVAVYRTLARRGRLFVEAPTGIGKTVAVWFPALKALAEGKLERLFYLTARTVGRTVAENALTELRRAGLRLRALTLTAREKLCVQAGRPCDPVTCPLATGYFDRRHPAMRELLSRENLTRTMVEAVGREHQVCPFELALDVSMWVDAVICDYNHAFDPRAYLRRHFTGEPGAHAFLVDEAHNLVDRGRDMFSAELDSETLREVGGQVRKSAPGCARVLQRLRSVLRHVAGTPGPLMEPSPPGAPPDEPDLFATTGCPAPCRRAPPPGAATPHRGDAGGGPWTSSSLPEALSAPLESALERLEAWLIQNPAGESRDRLLELTFRLLAFRRTAEVYDERFVTLLEPGREVRVRLFCLDPSALLRQGLDRSRGAVFFSATLSPGDYYRSLLGGEPDDPWLRMGSPFPADHLAVLVHQGIRTELAARAETLGDVVDAIGALVTGQPGNYLVYLPSYAYLTAARDAFQSRNPTIEVLTQRPGMSEPEREVFLETFHSAPGNTRVGFAVLGGIFAEGIDLVGNRLLGAVIVGVGLPQLCLERNVIGGYFQARTDAGFDYAYRFPGMNRVLQATGRVIRSEKDRGVVLLIDRRFAQVRYRRLFPAWWQPQPVRSVTDIRTAVDRFWSQPHQGPNP